MKVKIKGMENIHNVVAWSCQTNTNKSFIEKSEIIPVVIIIVKGTKKVMTIPVSDIEEIEQ